MSVEFEGSAEAEQRQRVKEHQARLVGNRLTAEEKLLHEAILRVIDDGCLRHKAPNYTLWTGDDQERLDFSRAVIQRWREFKQTDSDEQIHQRG